VFVDGEAVVRARTLVRGDWPRIRSEAESSADALWSHRPS
jgi:hypothetical protein